MVYFFAANIWSASISSKFKKGLGVVDSKSRSGFPFAPALEVDFCHCRVDFGFASAFGVV